MMQIWMKSSNLTQRMQRLSKSRMQSCVKFTDLPRKHPGQFYVQLSTPARPPLGIFPKILGFGGPTWDLGILPSNLGIFSKVYRLPSLYRTLQQRQRIRL